MMMKWTFWICAAFALCSALVAMLTGNNRRASFGLWLCGLGVGGIFLALRAEFLAVSQWILSTVVSLSFVAYSTLFGERETELEWKKLAAALFLSASVLATIWFGLRDFEMPMDVEAIRLGLNDLGGLMIKDYLIALEVLALTLFLVIVGAGVISRPEEFRK